MIPNDQPLRSEIIARMIKYLVDTLEKEDKSWFDWEENFIQSVYEQFEKRGDLSNKQCEILERLYDK